jgi:hypothetical protein
MMIESAFSWPEFFDIRFSESKSTVCIENLSKSQFVLIPLFRLCFALLLRFVGCLASASGLQCGGSDTYGTTYHAT